MTKKTRDKVDVVVLMAGEGKRLRPLTNDRPKALLCCEDDKSIFHHLVEAVAAQPWDATVVPVIGHGRQKVHQEMDTLTEIISFNHVYNPFYISAGPLISLWLGVLQAKNDHLLVVNGDTLVNESLMSRVYTWLQQGSGDIGLSASNTSDFQADDMKVALDDQGSFAATGKDIEPGPQVMKSAGVVAIKGKPNRTMLKELLDQMVMDEQCLSRKFYWHNVLDEVVDDFKIDIIPVSPDSWYEIDTKIDFNSVASAES